MKKKSKHSFKKVKGKINSVCQADGFFISYNPCCFDTCKDETALVKEVGDSIVCNYYILEGDWREDYLKIIDKGYEACEDFFIRHIKHAGYTSQIPDRYEE